MLTRAKPSCTDVAKPDTQQAEVPNSLPISENLR